MKPDVAMRLALWLVERSSVGRTGEAFAGDLLEYFANGRSSWWCFAQALFKAVSSVEQRLRSLLVPLCYCFAFVFLHPLWQRLCAPSVAGLLTRYRGTALWPGSAALEITAGLVPAVLFVWVGIFVYLLIRRQMLQGVNPVSLLLSLNVAGCLLLGEIMLRLGSMQHDLRLLSRADFYYPLGHTRFSVLLFFSLFMAIAMLPGEHRPGRPNRYFSRLLSYRDVLRFLQGFGFMALFVPSLRWDIEMRYVRKLLFFIAPMILAWPLAAGAQDAAPRLMTADGKPMEFDVVSVKPNESGATAMNIMSPPMSDGVTITNMPPENILQWAFGIFLSDRISGLPGWARQERYDAAAKVSDADVAAFRKVVDPIQRAPMLQEILVDHFNLKFHYETRELPVYALVVGKTGIKMTEIQPAIGPNGMKDGGGRQVSRGQIRSMGQSMKPLVNALTMELGRTVVDRTGLTGFYNFTLRWTPVEGAPPAGDAAEDTSAPSIFTAVQEQLGLKLEATKAPVQVLVIDRLERPSAN